MIHLGHRSAHPVHGTVVAPSSFLKKKKKKKALFGRGLKLLKRGTSEKKKRKRRCLHLYHTAVACAPGLTCKKCPGRLSLVICSWIRPLRLSWHCIQDSSSCAGVSNPSRWSTCCRIPVTASTAQLGASKSYTAGPLIRKRTTAATSLK